METSIDFPQIVSADDLFDGEPANVPGELRTAAGVLKQVAPQTAVVAKTDPADAVATIKETVLSLFRATEPEMQALAERYRAVAFNVKTLKGLGEAKAARHDLRENGRYAVQRAEDRIKKALNGAKAVLTDEAARLVAIVQPSEDAIDGQIKVREAEIEAEKVEAARLEALALAEHQARVDNLIGLVGKAQGKRSTQIATGITIIEALVIDPAKWGRAEWVAQGEKAKADTIAALRKMHDETKTAEEVQAQREENARVAAELAERKRQMDAENAERKARADREEAERQRQVAAAKKAEDDAAAALAAVPVPEPEPVPAPAEVILHVHTDQGYRRVKTTLAEPDAPATLILTPAEALAQHALSAFSTKFPNQPKPGVEWWAELRRLATEVAA